MKNLENKRTIKYVQPEKYEPTLGMLFENFLLFWIFVIKYIAEHI